MTGRPTVDRGSQRSDLVVAGAAVGLVAVAAVVGLLLRFAGRPVLAPAAPFFGHWLPHVGPGTPAAVTVAALVVHQGPAVAARLAWRRLLPVAYLTALAWSASLALVDGWQRGIAGRLTTTHEYLHEVPGVRDVATMLAGFAGRILDQQPDSWTTHVAGHPPGALLVFVLLDRAGAGGGAWAGLLCIAAGASVAVSVPVTVRLLAGPDAARAAVPFVVLFPGAVWLAVSADSIFTAVTAGGIALLAYAVRGRGVVAVLAGVLLAFGCFLSYGLVLMAPVALVVVIAGRRIAPVPWALVGAVAVTAGFALAGFWWLDGYHLVVRRYYQGIAADRPYGYWVWANIACLVAVVGPAGAAIIRRVAASAWRRRLGAVVLLPLAGLAAVVLADATGLSKAETERIWLPFAVWFTAGAALLPAGTRRGWLAGQAATALIVNHLLLTAW